MSLRRAYVSRAVSTLGLGLACLAASCGGQRADPVECWEGEAEGSWTKVFYPPEHLGGDPGVSDGVTYSLILRHPVCESCTIAELDTDGSSWSTYETSGVYGEFNASEFSLSPEYLAASDFSNFENGWRIYSRTFALLDRETRNWIVTEPPEEYEGRFGADLHWTGSSFVLWGGDVTDDGRGVLESETVIRSFYDGATYDPAAGTWDVVLPAWPIGEFLYEDNDPQGQMSSVWTPDGLFVWGSKPDESAAALAIYDIEEHEWRYPEPEHSPEPRRYHQLLYHDRFVYLVGGFRASYHWGNHGPSAQGPRDLWRFSLDELQWEQLEVPKYADLEVASGQWIGDRLVLLGQRCASGSAFSAKDGRWEPIAGEGRPPLAPYVIPSVGELAVAGDSLVVNAVSSDGTFEDSAVWIFEF